MINWIINWSPINNFETLLSSSSVISSSSFSSLLLTKYGFKSTNGIFFNFNNMEFWNTYWNRMTDHNFDDIAQVDVYKYGNALKNWWTIYDRRYKEKTFSIEIIIHSDTLSNLETEIRNLKSALEVWGECYKNEISWQLKVNVQLIEISVSRLLLYGTTVKIKMLTMDPFWSTRNAITTFNEWNIWSFSWSLTLSNTKIKGFAKHIIYTKIITWTINTLTLTISWYPITVNQTIISWSTIILDGINNDVFVNWTKVKYLWQFPELEIWMTHPLLVTFWWGWSVDNFDLYNIYENKQL